jgi:SpoVK/Ycf46/Vps4 family AAA+-type ATPase
VVSKYIGETEKNLERLFTVADGTGAVLFFDEADALFGKRTKVQDAHDRYANIEVSYLLQRMDCYDGVAVLATNLRENLDEAFARRLDHIVEFELPDAALRRRLWAVVLPPGAPLAADVDLDALAERHPLTGANIRNVAVDAAFRAAHDRVPIGRVHLGEAIRREYQKLGRVLRPDSPEGS